MASHSDAGAGMVVVSSAGGAGAGRVSGQRLAPTFQRGA